MIETSRKTYFQNYKNIKPSKHDKKMIEIETFFFKTMLGSCLCTIILNHNLLEQAGACYGPWVCKASYKT